MWVFWPFYGLSLVGSRKKKLAGERRDVFGLALRNGNIWKAGGRGGVRKGD